MKESLRAERGGGPLTVFTVEATAERTNRVDCWDGGVLRPIGGRVLRLAMLDGAWE